MMKFLAESVDAPHVGGVKNERLPLPNPGVDEYRRYWNEHEERHTEYDTDSVSGDVMRAEVVELAASFVSASCDHEPSDEEWRECLLEEGYPEKQVATILGSEASGEEAPSSSETESEVENA